GNRPWTRTRAAPGLVLATQWLGSITGQGTNAPLPSGREGLDAGSPGRGPRQPGPRIRAHAPQRRLAGGGRAGTAARRLVALEVLRLARGAPGRRLEARAAEARDVHERVRPLGRRGGALLQGARRVAAGRPRRRRPRAGPSPGAARGRARRAQRPALARAAPGDAGLP